MKNEEWRMKNSSLHSSFFILHLTHMRLSMEIGIGLPNTLKGATGGLVLEWARRADASPFASLGVFDRLRYDSFDPLIGLAAAAGATARIRLATTIITSPLRNDALLAKEVASLDALSAGRLTLG